MNKIKNQWFIQMQGSVCVCVRVCLLSFGLFCYLLHCNCKHFFIRYVYTNPMRGFGVTAWIMLTTAVPREALPIIHTASVHQVLQCMHNNYSTGHAPGKVAIFLWNRQTQLGHATTTSQYFCGTTKLRQATQQQPHDIFVEPPNSKDGPRNKQSHSIFVELPNSNTGHATAKSQYFRGTAKLRQAMWRSHWQCGCGKERMSGPIPCGV